MICQSNSVAFEAEKDIPSLDGKVILVTGGNVGLGKQAVLEYARHNPGLIWLGARSVQKANAAIDEIRQQVPNAAIQVLELDLSSFASIKKAAATVLSTSPRLDILMLNAGIMATPPGLTKDGYESQFGTNHMGHALLTKLLLPLLTKTATTTDNALKQPHLPTSAVADVRVISLSSDGHTMAPKGGIMFDTLKTDADALGALGRYGQSKLANVLWGRQLARAQPQLTVAVVHPGIVQTQLMERAMGVPAVVRGLTRVAVGMNLLTPVDRGVRNQLWASVATKGLVSGEYYQPVGVGGKASAYGKDEELARKLWEWTEKELEGHAV
jgi:NAD(P)-dependent dehydrogenase (short-subunit alcohol dehydrogenase family)